MLENKKFYETITPKPYKEPQATPQQATHTPPPQVKDTVSVERKTKERFLTLGYKWFVVFGILLVSILLATTFIHKISITTNPAGASITHSEPWLFAVEDSYYALRGAYTVSVSASGYKTQGFDFYVSSTVDKPLYFELEKKPGHLQIMTIPPVNATISLDGKSFGVVPITIRNIKAGEHIVMAEAVGYQPTSRTIVIMGMDKTQTLTIPLQKIPPQRKATQTKKKLPKKPVKRKTRKDIETEMGLQFVTFKPNNEQVSYYKGRLLYTATLSRPFAIAKTEVTNKQFKAFKSSHASGNYQGNSLDGDNQPVVNISWSEAALFANWLSKRAGIVPFYKVQNNMPLGFRADSSGFRLVTEAEWVSILAKAYRHRFWWGKDFDRVGEKHGNYADKSAAPLLTRTLEYYTDGHIVSAPVASFYPNAYGLYDIEGNVAEWLHDVFTIGPYNQRINPLGPERGATHIIRGGSWKHGTRRMLDTTYRNYYIDQGKPEVGFRLAYYLN